ncbi:hypothetical protein [Spirillospora sp. CA-294931]|uniref:hypothetical protein n=1 Tax=Spirillospora sp. CA-294931 TaxID=3240042 RepID=UPI003D8DEC8E
MEIDEVAARVVRGYWKLLLAMTVLPLLLAGFVMSGQEPSHTATARLQASGRLADALPGDAGVSSVVSQVKAFATSRTLLDRVLAEQGVARSPEKVAKAVSVAALGTSTVVELGVEDTDPQVARRLSDAIGAAVVTEINRSNQGPLTAQLTEIEKRIRDLEAKLGPLARKAGAANPDIGAGAERERVAAELSDLRISRTGLRTQLTSAGNASVVQPAVLAPPNDPTVMTTAIAGLLGLIGGILVAVLIEMFRPTVAGQQRAARRLGVPLLGWADRTDAGLADLARRIRLAAKREGVGQVALVSAGGGPLPPDLVSKIAAAVYGDATKLIKAGRPSPNGNGEPKDGDEDGKPAGPPPPRGAKAVARAGTALIPATSTEAQSPTEVTQPVSQRSLCHVHAFEDIDPGADDRVGVVAVVGPVTRISGLESVRDLVSASGWPLLGVIAMSHTIKG